MLESALIQAGVLAGRPKPAPLREVLSRFATGIVVLTVGGEHIHGMTANAFGSVSLDPPLVQCTVAHSAVMHGSILAAGSFGVSIMSADQEHLARYFSDRERPLGSAQFTPVDYVRGPHTGAPLLTGALAWLECRLNGVREGGDHSIFLGDVLGAVRAESGQALLFFDRGYHDSVPRQH